MATGADEAEVNQQTVRRDAREQSGKRPTRNWIAIVAILLFAIASAFLLARLLNSRDWARAEHQRNYTELSRVARALEAWPLTVDRMAKSHLLKGRLEPPPDASMREHGWHAAARIRHPEVGTITIHYRLNDSANEKCVHDTQQTARFLEPAGHLNMLGEVSIRGLWYEDQGQVRPLSEVPIPGRAAFEALLDTLSPDLMRPDTIDGDPFDTFMAKLGNPLATEVCPVADYRVMLPTEALAQMPVNAPGLSAVLVLDRTGKVIARFGPSVPPVGDVSELILQDSGYQETIRSLVSAATGKEDKSTERRDQARRDALSKWLSGSPLNVTAGGDRYVSYIRPLSWQYSVDMKLRRPDCRGNPIVETEVRTVEAETVDEKTGDMVVREETTLVQKGVAPAGQGLTESEGSGASTQSAAAQASAGQAASADATAILQDQCAVVALVRADDMRQRAFTLPSATFTLLGLLLALAIALVPVLKLRFLGPGGSMSGIEVAAAAAGLVIATALATLAILLLLESALSHARARAALAETARAIATETGEELTRILDRPIPVAPLGLAPGTRHPDVAPAILEATCKVPAPILAGLHGVVGQAPASKGVPAPDLIELPVNPAAPANPAGGAATRRWPERYTAGLFGELGLVWPGTRLSVWRCESGSRSNIAERPYFRDALEGRATTPFPTKGKPCVAAPGFHVAPRYALDAVRALTDGLPAAVLAAEVRTGSPPPGFTAPCAGGTLAIPPLLPLPANEAEVARVEDIAEEILKARLSAGVSVSDQTVATAMAQAAGMALDGASLSYRVPKGLDRGPTRGVALIAFVPRSLLRPVLAPHQQFMVLNPDRPDWPYLFGSHPGRIGTDRLKESFAGTDAETAILTARRRASGQHWAVAAPDRFTARFEGIDHAFAAVALPGTPWVLLVHQPLETIDRPLGRTAAYAGFAWAGLALLVALLLFALARRRPAWVWLWPSPASARAATQAADVITALALLAAGLLVTLRFTRLPEIAQFLAVPFLFAVPLLALLIVRRALRGELAAETGPGRALDWLTRRLGIGFAIDAHKSLLARVQLLLIPLGVAILLALLGGAAIEWGWLGAIPQSGLMMLCLILALGSVLLFAPPRKLLNWRMAAIERRLDTTAAAARPGPEPLRPRDERAHARLHRALGLAFGMATMLALYTDAVVEAGSREQAIAYQHFEQAHHTNREALRKLEASFALENASGTALAKEDETKVPWIGLLGAAPEAEDGSFEKRTHGLSEAVRRISLSLVSMLRGVTGEPGAVPADRCDPAARADTPVAPRYCLTTDGEVRLAAWPAPLAFPSIPAVAGLLFIVPGLVFLLAAARQAFARSLFGFGTAIEAVVYPVIDLINGKPRIDPLTVILNPPLALEDCLRKNGRVLDLGDPNLKPLIDPATDPLKSLLDYKAGGGTIVAIGLDLALKGVQSRLAALALLEHLAAEDGGNLVLLSDLSPLDRILQAFEREMAEDPISSLEQLRWSRLFERFTTKTLRPTPNFRWSAAEQQAVRKTLDNEHSFAPGEIDGIITLVGELRLLPEAAINPLFHKRPIVPASTSYPVDQDVLHDAYLGAAIKYARSVRPVSPAAAIDHLRGILIEHYQHIWAASSHAERLILDTLARGRRINVADALAIRSLVRRGLVVLHPDPQIMNASFRAFIRQVERPQTIAKYKSEQGKSPWDRAALPLAILLPLLVGGAFGIAALAGGEVFQLVPVLFSAGPAAVAAVANLFRRSA